MTDIFKKPKGLSRKDDKELWKTYINLPTSKRSEVLTKLRDECSLIDVLKINSLKDLDTQHINDIISYLILDGIAVVQPLEAKLLYKMACACNGTIIEIGTCRAGSTVLLGLSDPENSNRVYSIDVVGESCANNLVKQFGLNCNLIEAHSHEYGESWNKGPIDMVFIDGNHMTEHIYKDMVIWSKYVRVGGHLLVHDCLSKNSVRTFRRRGRINNSGVILSHVDNTNVNVYNAIKRFSRGNSIFQEMEQIKSIKVIKRIK